MGEGERKREIPCIVGEGKRERERETNDVLELEASLAVHALQTQMQKFCYISKTTQNLQ